MSLSLSISTQRAQSRVLVLSTMLSLAGCASSTTPIIERPLLPDAPPNFGKPVALPEVMPGKRLDVFALENRAAAEEANRRLAGDNAFYGDVRREFSQ